MATDPRHLRARWILAGIGWSLWAILMSMPYPGSPSRRLWHLYPELVTAIGRNGLRLANREEILLRAAMLGGVIATVIFCCSPVLMACNHSRQARVRRWRWLGLFAAAEFSVMLMFRGNGLSPLHLGVLSHLIVCMAIIPWPRERAITGSGFDVLIPNQPTAER